MKKLTAGILTVMLGIVAANSADASIASKGYVDTQVGTKVSTSDFETFKGKNTTAIAEAKQAGTDAKNALDAYQTSNDAAVAAKADTATVNAELAKKQNKLTAGTNIAIAEDGTISTVGIATTEGLKTLESTVAGHTTQLGTLTGTAETEGSVAKSIADAVKSTKTAYEAADATTLQSAKDYADGLATNYATAAQGALADTAVQPAALTAVDNKFADYTTTTDMNAKLDTKADKTTIGNVDSGKTVVQMITEAKNAASGDTTALAGRVTTIEQSAAYTSGIDAEKVAQIATNKTDIAANKTKVEAVTKDLADNYTKTDKLSALAKAEIPATCEDLNAANGCVLILKNGEYSWEVIERDAENK